jgi:hypothetical protein
MHTCVHAHTQTHVFFLEGHLLNSFRHTIKLTCFKLKGSSQFSTESWAHLQDTKVGL